MSARRRRSAPTKSRRRRRRTTTWGARARPRYGEAGYRYHAVVPEAEAMDYKVRPKLVHDPSEIKARTQNAQQQRVRKLVGKVAKNKGIKESKAYVPSVEGRGMVSYH